MSFDEYTCFAELAQAEVYGTDYVVSVTERPSSPVLILAPHGGRIEAGTTEIASAIAGAEHSFFSFEGLKPAGNRALHITSSRFDHPMCLALIARCAVAIAIHGCLGESNIYVGGLDAPLAALLTRNLAGRGLPVLAHGHSYPGQHPLNICNRTSRRCGAQLEFTLDLRAPAALAQIAPAVREAITEYVASLGIKSL